AVIAHRIFPRLSYEQYKISISIAYIFHGAFFALFSLSPSFTAAVIFVGLSRAAVGVSAVANSSQLLRHVSNEYRGRVFSTVETWTWMTMLISMSVAGWASDHASPRKIGAVAAIFSASTAFFWGWANLRGRLPEPALSGIDPEDVEVHGEPVA